MKFSLTRRIELIAEAGPFARSIVQNQTGNGVGALALGLQGVVYQGEAARPTIALSYLRQVYGGDTPDLDIGSATNSFLFLASADLKGFHYDANLFFNDVVDSAIHRAQFGQTLSVSHSLSKKWGLTGEIWHFTQPALNGDAVGNLWALNYNLRKNLVFDGGFNRGLTSTSTQWEVFFGFTYLLPHKLALGNHVKHESRKEPIQTADRGPIGSIGRWFRQLALPRTERIPFNAIQNVRVACRPRTAAPFPFVPLVFQMYWKSGTRIR